MSVLQCLSPSSREIIRSKLRKSCQTKNVTFYTYMFAVRTSFHSQSVSQANWNEQRISSMFPNVISCHKKQETLDINCEWENEMIDGANGRWLIADEQRGVFHIASCCYFNNITDAMETKINYYWINGTCHVPCRHRPPDQFHSAHSL